MSDVSRIISQMIPRREQLPRRTGIGGRIVPLESQPLGMPNMNVLDNPRIMALLEIDNPISSRHIRAQAMAQLTRMLEGINEYIISKLRYTGVRFYTEERSNRVVAVIRDVNTGEVLKVFPSRAILEVAARLRKASGILVDMRT
jgi:uncharacterized FlaG/YvyC family protein